MWVLPPKSITYHEFPHQIANKWGDIPFSDRFICEYTRYIISFKKFFWFWSEFLIGRQFPTFLQMPTQISCGQRYSLCLIMQIQCTVEFPLRPSLKNDFPVSFQTSEKSLKMTTYMNGILTMGKPRKS